MAVRPGPAHRLRLLLLLLLSLCPAVIHSHGSFEGEETSSTPPVMPTLPPETIQKYFTEELIQAEGSDPQACSERVFAERARRASSISLGVEPTVGLGWALLIFVFVGFFAAGIAQAFQMVGLTLNSTVILYMLE